MVKYCQKAVDTVVRNYGEFCEKLLKCGFSMGGGNAKGIYAIVPYSWEEQDAIDSPVKWHTGDADTDPWEWRMRVLEERDDVAYSKLFFRTSGFITKEWYPYFLAVRRGGATFEEAYYDGGISAASKRIYTVLEKNGATPLHEIKRLADVKKDESSVFERSLTELQMRMYITMCGRAQKVNKYGEGYGWNSTVLTTVEDFWQSRGVVMEEKDADDAYQEIKEQILRLNPNAEQKKIDKFIRG